MLFENLDLTLNNGQLMYVTGANGAGKTTLLRSLAGLHQYTDGNILYNDEPLSEHLSDILYIGHKAAINDYLTASENILHWLSLVDLQADINELINKVGLAGLENVPVRYLSAGQKRRVALVRLWVSKAKIWILDEPYTSIDANGIDILNQLFSRHAAAGNIVIVTSHQPLPESIVNVNLHLEYRF